MDKLDKEIFLYTDGSSIGNPGPGGYGIIMELKGTTYKKEFSKGYRHTTNNRMELLAIIVGLESLKKESSKVIVYSDSLIHHIVEKDTVLTYTNIRVGGNEIPENYLNRIGESLFDGYISLQSEGHPVEFREIKIKELN